MVKIDIWVEGPADQKFLADLLKMETWFNIALNERFEFKSDERKIDLKILKTDTVNPFISEKEWRKTKKQDFQDNKTKGVRNVVIIDADEDCSNRRKTVEKTVGDIISKEALFLFPNDEDNGDLESLLERIIHPDHKPIFDCWDGYEKCLKSKHENYTTPARKTKIYAYLEALLGQTKKEKEKIKEIKRDYTNPDHWDLDNSKEPLKPLYDFLKSHIESTN